MLEYGWGRGSYCLQVRDATWHSLRYGVQEDDFGDFLSLEDMDAIFAIVIRDMEQPRGRRRSQANMYANYLYSVHEYRRRLSEYERRHGG